jgi:hypothetical protein
MEITSGGVKLKDKVAKKWRVFMEDGKVVGYLAIYD